jgi:hypothetical protein
MRERTLNISLASASAIGDVRTLQNGDVIRLHTDAPRRKDWSRYADAITTAVTRGADIVKVR